MSPKSKAEFIVRFDKENGDFDFKARGDLLAIYYAILSAFDQMGKDNNLSLERMMKSFNGAYSVYSVIKTKGLS